MTRKQTVKLSVSVPGDVVAGARRYVGRRGLSGFVSTAMRHELEREELGDFLRELDQAHGPVKPSVLKEVRAAWRGR